MTGLIAGFVTEFKIRSNLNVMDLTVITMTVMGMGDTTENTPTSREPSNAPDKPDSVDRLSMLFSFSVLLC